MLSYSEVKCVHMELCETVKRVDSIFALSHLKQIISWLDIMFLNKTYSFHKKRKKLATFQFQISNIQLKKKICEINAVPYLTFLVYGQYFETKKLPIS